MSDNFEQIIYMELANKDITQSNIAITYSYLLTSGCSDWLKLNTAIIDKWSLSGLQKIKKMAWKIASGRDEENDR